MEKYLLYTRKNISMCVVYIYMGSLWKLAEIMFIFNNFNDVLFLYLNKWKN